MCISAEHPARSDVFQVDSKQVATGRPAVQSCPMRAKVVAGLGLAFTHVTVLRQRSVNHRLSCPDLRKRAHKGNRVEMP
jgi:hypothetical protein